MTAADKACLKCAHPGDALELLCAPDAYAAPPASMAPLARLRSLVPGVARSIIPGQHVSLEGEASGQVIGVLSGLVRCFRLTTDGRRHICRFAASGSLIGLGLLGVQRHSAEAVTASEIITFRAAAIDVALDRDPRVRVAILQSLAEELTEREHIQLRLGRFSADQRVADFLLELSPPQSGSLDCDIPMSRADIADHLGVTFETVSRALHRFDKLRLIRLLDAHHFRVLRRNGLTDFAAGDQPVHLQLAQA